MLEEKKDSFNMGYALKGALILCVLFGHSVSMINGLRAVSWNSSPINIFLTSFEMPAFMLVSGYYLGSSLSRHSPNDVFFRRLLSIGSTLICWVAVPTVVNAWLIDGNNNVLSIIKTVVSNTIGGKLWYLFSYLFCSVVLLIAVVILRRLFRNSSYSEAIGLCIVMVLISMCDRIPGHSPFLFPFFVLGYLIFRFSVTGKVWFPKMVLFCSLLFLVLIPFYTPDISFYILSPAITNFEMVPKALFRTVIGFVGGVVCTHAYVGFSAQEFVCGWKELEGKALQCISCQCLFKSPCVILLAD